MNTTKSKIVTKGAAQGDLLIIRITEIPASATPEKPENGRLILARGEATGHHHSLPHKAGVALFRDEQPGVLYFRADEQVSLDHQEHSTITFSPASYKVIRQRTFAVGMARRVED